MRKSERGWVSGLLGGAVLWVSGPVLAQDVSFMGVVKGVAHWQSGPATVGLSTPPFQFNAFLELTAPGRVLGASVTPAGKAPLALATDDASADYGAEFGLKTALDAAFPNGTFTLNVTGQNDGLRTLTLLLTGDAYPSVPTLNNYTALQNVPAEEPLTLSWQPFAGGTLLDFVQVSVRRLTENGEQTVFETSGPGQAGGLNGTHTSVTVPAGTLATGQAYQARLLFAKIVALDATSYGQGVTAIAGYFRETRLSLVTVGSPDFEAPQLRNSSPSASDGPVPRNSGIALQFSERMQARQSLNWTGLDSTKLTYRWSGDGRVLYCLYSQPLPAGATVTWRLDRSGFRDVAGNVLASDAQGSFTTGTASAAGTPDIAFAGLYKMQSFTQLPGGSPQIRAEGGYGAGAFANSTGFNTLVGGALRLPGGETVPLDYDGGDALRTETQLNSKAELDANAPPGIYQLTVEGAHRGTQTVTLDVPADAYPAAPEFLNLSAAQGFDPAQPLTLSWKPMPGGTVNDFIGLWIEPENGDGSVFETPDFETGQGLNGTATSVTIPAGTLRAGRTYRAELEFAHPTFRDTTTLPGSLVVIAYTRMTQVSLTAAGTVPPPAIQLTPLTAGRWQLRITGETGVNYVLESTSELGNGWGPRVNFQISGAAYEFEDGVAADQRFYRVREGF